MSDDNNILAEEALSGGERYINPCTDFGFKKLFGTPMNKDLLISFLNSLLGDEASTIADIQYLNSEHLGDGYGDRRAVFDVYCLAEDGSRFIVEMQKREQEYFKDRTLFYSTYAIREQAPKLKNWNYRLDDVYIVAVLDFEFPHGEYPPGSYRHVVKLKDADDNHIFYKKLTFVYLELPKFNGAAKDLASMSLFERWMFVLNNLTRLMERPKALQDSIFDRLFEQAEIAKYSPQERMEYVFSRKNYWDYNNTLDFSHKKGRQQGRQEGLQQGRQEGLQQGRQEGLQQGRQEGLQQGRQEGLQQGRQEGLQQGRQEGARQERAETVKRLNGMGLTPQQIAQGTGMTAEEVSNLLKTQQQRGPDVLT